MFFHSVGPSYLVAFSLKGLSTWLRCFSKSIVELSSSAYEKKKQYKTTNHTYRLPREQVALI